ncbi:MAG: HAMP domain-containing histidine kinase [Oscillospiraceae bacterium]|nr:HAMP domain-containing histidine kinase [Oscillospiraceae bacterium]
MKKDKNDPNHNKFWSNHNQFWIVVIFAGYLAAFVAAYLISALIYGFTGSPPELMRHLISGIIAMAIMMFVARLIFYLRGGSRRDEYNKNHMQITEALAQIAQGNFDVLLEPNPQSPHNDMTRAFNEMAQSLGTLESMRQDFISNVSHEIQSPLTSIGGFAALLQKDELPDDERRRYATVIEAESKRLSSLSDNLLKLSSLDIDKMPLSKTKFRLDKQLERIALTLEPQWSAKKLLLEADMQKLTVCGDEDLLSQVWMNLLHNAIKFTPEGGQINIALAADNKSACVKVSDTGVGIAPDDQMHIFERFYKADKSRDRALGGNGLGLSLVKKIVELHGGRIAVESEIGKGTAFAVSLPVK